MSTVTVWAKQAFSIYVASGSTCSRQKHLPKVFHPRSKCWRHFHTGSNTNLNVLIPTSSVGLNMVIWVVHQTSMAHTPLVSMVKDNNGATVWSNGAWNKYDPIFSAIVILAKYKIHNIQAVGSNQELFCLQRIIISCVWEFYLEHLYILYCLTPLTTIIKSVFLASYFHLSSTRFHFWIPLVGPI